MIQRKAYSQAQQELENDLGRSDKLGAHYQGARIQFLLGTALRLEGNQPEASQHYRLTVKLIDDMAKDAGAEKIQNRPDIKSMYSEALQFSNAAR